MQNNILQYQSVLKWQTSWQLFRLLTRMMAPRHVLYIAYCIVLYIATSSYPQPACTISGTHDNHIMDCHINSEAKWCIGPQRTFHQQCHDTILISLSPYIKLGNQQRNYGHCHSTTEIEHHFMNITHLATICQNQLHSARYYY